eukprot:14798214-Alexandrium_andersonii.AAC.1
MLGAPGRAKAVTFPGYRRGHADVTFAVALSPEGASQRRALGARASFRSVDRPDLSFAAKECCR